MTEAIVVMGVSGCGKSTSGAGTASSALKRSYREVDAWMARARGPRA